MEGRNLILMMELLVALIATGSYYKYRHNNLRYFLWYVWGIVLVEFFGTWWSSSVQTSNLWIYNVLVILEFPLLILWYRSFLSSPGTRKVLVWVIFVFLIFSMINTGIFQSFQFEFKYFNFILGAISLIIAIFLYFNEVLHTDKILVIQRGLLFWVSVGFLFFYASVIPIMIMGNIYHHDGWIYNVFLLILNIILHICFLIGLLWGQKKYN